MHNFPSKSKTLSPKLTRRLTYEISLSTNTKPALGPVAEAQADKPLHNTLKSCLTIYNSMKSAYKDRQVTFFYFSLSFFSCLSR